jgi:hypothetical protein
MVQERLRKELRLGTGFRTPAAGTLIDRGTTVPTAASSGYAIGGTFHHTDGGAGTSFYVNEGTAGSCLFRPVVAIGAVQTVTLATYASTSERT